MNSKECLKHICDECQKNAGKIQVACPFRSISNEYCDEYETIKKDLDQLEQLESENKKLSCEVDELLDNKLELVVKNKQQDMLIGKLIEENTKLKKALDILKEKLDIKLEVYHSGGCTLNHKIIPNCVTPNERCLRYLEVEEYELLKEVLDCE